VDFWLIFLVFGPVLMLGLIVSVSLVLRLYGIKRFSLSFVLGHLVYFIVLAFVYFGRTQDAQAELFWLIPGILDLPISLLVLLLTPSDVIPRVILLAILGSLQYTAIGWAIDVRIAKIRARREHSDYVPTNVSKYVFLVIGMTLLVVSTAWLYTRYRTSRDWSVEIREDVRAGRSQQTTEPRFGVKKAVIAAAEDLPAEATLKKENIGVLTVPEHQLPESYVEISGARTLIGKKVLRAINKNEPISWNDVSELEGGRVTSSRLIGVTSSLFTNYIQASDSETKKWD